jgi:hypothetical protein
MIDTIVPCATDIHRSNRDGRASPRCCPLVARATHCRPPAIRRNRKLSAALCCRPQCSHDLSSIMNRKPDPYGRDARRPYQIPLKGWWQVAQRVWSESNRDNLSVVVVGCAFFALFAIFPALSALISLWSDCGSRDRGAALRHAWFRPAHPSLRHRDRADGVGSMPPFCFRYEMYSRPAP